MSQSISPIQDSRIQLEEGQGAAPAQLPEGDLKANGVAAKVFANLGASASAALPISLPISKNTFRCHEDEVCRKILHFGELTLQVTFRFEDIEEGENSHYIYEQENEDPLEIININTGEPWKRGPRECVFAEILSFVEDDYEVRWHHLTFNRFKFDRNRTPACLEDDDYEDDRSDVQNGETTEYGRFLILGHLNGKPCKLAMPFTHTSGWNDLDEEDYDCVQEDSDNVTILGSSLEVCRLFDYNEDDGLVVRKS